MSAVLWPVTARIVTALNTANGTSEHEAAMRLMKVVEEAGEASAAYIGMTGQNPRKGTTHTAADVADELCDVIIAATVALHAFTTAPPAVLDAKLHAVARRLDTAAPQPTADSEPVTGETVPEWPTASEAYADAPHPRDEFDWLISQAHLGKRDREWWLRRAAVVDRRSAHIPPDHHLRDEQALELAHFLIELDGATVAGDPRTYVRQQYAAWRQQEQQRPRTAA
ncbi:MazG-like family protein [Streptomyces sp. NBC_01515]|uniref:MazG-like family protein n=1 Tax=Streptomyces sp. NBC_01515 TaxID=2903890 RepID=UPI003866DBF7